VGQNEVIDVVLWKDTSHRLHRGDDEFLKPPFVRFDKAARTDSSSDYFDRLKAVAVF
jgi:hypothetical protein